MTPQLIDYRTKADWLAAAIAAHDSEECLMWPFAVDADGYGRVCFYGDGKKDRVFAHRVSFRLVHGRWPQPLGLHKCDTPGCFNPRHIFEGTHAENHADQFAKGRTVKGVMQQDAKLTNELIASIRKEYWEGRDGYKKLADKYGTSAAAMRSAINGKTWKHVPGAVPAKRMTMDKSPTCGRGHILNDETCYVYSHARYCKTCTVLRAKKRSGGKST